MGCCQVIRYHSDTSPQPQSPHISSLSHLKTSHHAHTGAHTLPFISSISVQPIQGSLYLSSACSHLTWRIGLHPGSWVLTSSSLFGWTIHGETRFTRRSAEPGASSSPEALFGAARREAAPQGIEDGTKWTRSGSRSRSEEALLGREAPKQTGADALSRREQPPASGFHHQAFEVSGVGLDSLKKP